MKPKKSLGQNFLTSTHVLSEIVRASEVTAGDTVVEIGPGKGFLTRALVDSGAHVIAIEKDDELVIQLKQTFLKEIIEKKLELIHADILDCEIPHVSKTPYRLIANIPYYITGQILRMFLETDKKPLSMTVLVQKEVAERIIARDGKESLLSLSVKAYGTPVYIKTVSKGSFYPKPGVDSAILHIHTISNNRFSENTEKLFFTLIHKGFAHKRKQLLPNLSEVKSKKILMEAFDALGLLHTCRAEDLSIETWVQLTNSILKRNSEIKN